MTRHTDTSTSAATWADVQRLLDRLLLGITYDDDDWRRDYYVRLVEAREVRLVGRLWRTPEGGHLALLDAPPPAIRGALTEVRLPTHSRWTTDCPTIALAIARRHVAALRPLLPPPPERMETHPAYDIDDDDAPPHPAASPATSAHLLLDRAVQLRRQLAARDPLRARLDVVVAELAERVALRTAIHRGEQRRLAVRS